MRRKKHSIAVKKNDLKIDALNIAIKYKKKKKLMYAKTEEIEQYKKLQEERMLLKLKSQTKNTKSMKSLSRASTVKSFQSTQKLPKIKSSASIQIFDE